MVPKNIIITIIGILVLIPITFISTIIQIFFFCKTYILLKFYKISDINASLEVFNPNKPYISSIKGLVYMEPKGKGIKEALKLFYKMQDKNNELLPLILNLCLILFKIIFGLPLIVMHKVAHLTEISTELTLRGVFNIKDLICFFVNESVERAL